LRRHAIRKIVLTKRIKVLKARANKHKRALETADAKNKKKIQKKLKLVKSSLRKHQKKLVVVKKNIRKSTKLLRKVSKSAVV